jgi:pimeloyl-ACP methyl ester carboxylesterase
MQALKIEKPAIVGHSLGGLLALMIAAKAPDAVGKVMVVDALPFYALLFNPAATVEMTKPFAEQAKAPPARMKMRRAWCFIGVLPA